MRRNKIALQVITVILIVGLITFQVSAVQNNVSLRTLLTNDYAATYGNEQQEAGYRISAANYAFHYVWDIYLTPSYTYVSPVFIDNCSLPISTLCNNSACNSPCNNGTVENHNGIHHKNLLQNYYLIYCSISSSGYDLLMTLTSANCCNGTMGAAGPTSDYSFVANRSTYSTTLKARIIQHELSHNFGCEEGGCVAPCIMNGGYDTVNPYSDIIIWCVHHISEFDRDLH